MEWPERTFNVYNQLTKQGECYLSGYLMKGVNISVKFIVDILGKEVIFNYGSLEKRVNISVKFIVAILGKEVIHCI